MIEAYSTGDSGGNCGGGDSNNRRMSRSRKRKNREGK